MRNGDSLLKTIETVHAAGLDATHWPQALRAVGRLCGGVGTTLEVIDKATHRHRMFSAVGVPPAQEIAYIDYWAPRSPRVLHALHLMAGEVCWDYQILDERAMDRDGFYCELLPLTDFRYFIAGILNNTAAEYAVVSVQRTPRQGHVGDAEIAVMRRMIPHLQQALDVSARLKHAAGRAAAFGQALDWLVDGAALIRPDGRVVHCNQQLREIAQRRDGVSIDKGAISFTARSARANFARALATLGRFSNDQTEPAPLNDFTAARRAGVPAYVVSVRPLIDPNGGAREAVAIVFVHDPLVRNAGAVRLLRHLFGLTAAEAALAHALQTGVSPAAYARETALSPNTIYTHLRRIKEKTGCSRIAELTRKLNELRVPLRHE